MRVILPHQRLWQKNKDYYKKVLLYGPDIKGKIGQIQEVKFKADSMTNPHYHKVQEEIFYVLSGSAKIIINDRELRTHPGELIICEPNEIHQVINDTSQDFHLLVFKINPKKEDIFWAKEQPNNLKFNSQN